MKERLLYVSCYTYVAHSHETEGGAMDRIYIGVDFHARQQTICYLKIETGELVICELKHQDKQEVRAFYAQFKGR